MTQVPFDDDDGWDVLFKCDGCKAEKWDVDQDEPVTWSWVVGSCDGPDYCQECAKTRGIAPGGVLVDTP